MPITIRNSVILKDLACLGTMVFLAGAWFLCVHALWYVEDCPVTHSRRDVLEIHVCGITVSRKERERTSVIERLARDLDFDVDSFEWERYLRQRRWGLYFCAAPCHRGIYTMSGGGFIYERDMRPGLQVLIAFCPETREEFRRHVLEEYDVDYVRAFVSRCRWLSAPLPLP